MDDYLVEMMAGQIPERVRYAMECFGIPETMALFICILEHQPISNVKLIDMFKTDQAYLWKVIKPLGMCDLVEQCQWEGVILYRVTQFGEALFRTLFNAVIPDSHPWGPVKP
jgi:hypothetical protein